MLLHVIGIFGLFISLLHAQDISQFNKQFFDKLGLENHPVIIKHAPEIVQESNQTDELDSCSWQCLRILLGQETFVTDKKYKGAIEQMGIEYLDRSKYDPSSARMPSIQKHQLTLHERYFFERYYKYIEQKYEVPWYMKFISDTIGHGIFAAADIKNGDFVGDYGGIIYDRKTRDAMQYDPSYTWNINPPTNSGLQEAFLIDAKYACNFMRFINHSFEPNVMPIHIYGPDGWHLIYVACKDIKKDEQILVNYGNGYWSNKTPEKLN